MLSQTRSAPPRSSFSFHTPSLLSTRATFAIVYAPQAPLRRRRRCWRCCPADCGAVQSTSAVVCEWRHTLGLCGPLVFRLLRAEMKLCSGLLGGLSSVAPSKSGQSSATLSVWEQRVGSLSHGLLGRCVLMCSEPAVARSRSKVRDTRSAYGYATTPGGIVQCCVQDERHSRSGPQLVGRAIGPLVDGLVVLGYTTMLCASQTLC